MRTGRGCGLAALGALWLVIGCLVLLALAVGLARLDLLAAPVAGVALLLVRPFQVGDRVRYGETYGDVLSIEVFSLGMWQRIEELLHLVGCPVPADDLPFFGCKCVKGRWHN